VSASVQYITVYPPISHSMSIIIPNVLQNCQMKLPVKLEHPNSHTKKRKRFFVKVNAFNHLTLLFFLANAAKRLDDTEVVKLSNKWQSTWLWGDHLVRAVLASRYSYIHHPSHHKVSWL